MSDRFVPGEFLQLREGRMFTYLYDEQGFTRKHLREEDGHTMVLLEFDLWRTQEMLKVLLSGGLVGYINLHDVQRVGEPNPWPAEELEEDY